MLLGRFLNHKKFGIHISYHEGTALPKSSRETSLKKTKNRLCCDVMEEGKTFFLMKNCLRKL